MAAKPTEEWRNSSPVKIDDDGLSSDQSTSYEEEAHRTEEVMALGTQICRVFWPKHSAKLSKIQFYFCF